MKGQNSNYGVTQLICKAFDLGEEKHELDLRTELLSTSNSSSKGSVHFFSITLTQIFYSVSVQDLKILHCKYFPYLRKLEGDRII